MNRLVAVAKAADIPEGESKAVARGDEVIAVFNVDGAFYACSGVCPHAGGPLHQGFINRPAASDDAPKGPSITCPWHGWTFELGVNGESPQDGVTRYRVVVEGEEILLELPDQ